MSASPASTEHRTNGRFAPGNMGGPGNPHARQVAALRREILKQVTPEQLARVVAQVLLKAQCGDLAAARLILQYAVGKPAPTVDPDRLDIEEQELRREARVDLDRWQESLQTVSAKTANALDRAVWPGHEDKLAWKTAHIMGLLDDDIAKAAQRPSPNGDNGKVSIVGPSANGSNGGDRPTNGSDRRENAKSRGPNPSRAG